jgi:chromatin remodeling complex protein RSC6
VPDLEDKMTRVFRDISQENSKFSEFLNQQGSSMQVPPSESAKDIREALHDLELVLEKQDKSIDVLLDLFSDEIDLAGSSFLSKDSSKALSRESVTSKTALVQKRDALFKWISTGHRQLLLN